MYLLTKTDIYLVRGDALHSEASLMSWALWWTPQEAEIFSKCSARAQDFPYKLSRSSDILDTSTAGRTKKMWGWKKLGTMSYAPLCVYTKTISKLTDYLPKMSFSARISLRKLLCRTYPRLDLHWGSLADSKFCDVDHLWRDIFPSLISHTPGTQFAECCTLTIHIGEHTGKCS